jgi:hypothetical protein
VGHRGVPPITATRASRCENDARAREGTQPAGWLDLALRTWSATRRSHVAVRLMGDARGYSWPAKRRSSVGQLMHGGCDRWPTSSLWAIRLPRRFVRARNRAEANRSKNRESALSNRPSAEAARAHSAEPRTRKPLLRSEVAASGAPGRCIGCARLKRATKRFLTSEATDTARSQLGPCRAASGLTTLPGGRACVQRRRRTVVRAGSSRLRPHQPRQQAHEPVGVSACFGLQGQCWRGNRDVRPRRFNPLAMRPTRRAGDLGSIGSRLGYIWPDDGS